MIKKISFLGLLILFSTCAASFSDDMAPDYSVPTGIAPNYSEPINIAPGYNTHEQGVPYTPMSGTIIETDPLEKPPLYEAPYNQGLETPSIPSPPVGTPEIGNPGMYTD